MKYYEEMRTKFGFNDGESMPAGIEHYREVYIRAINALAWHNGSKFKAVPFDRNGMHNWCFILFVPRDVKEPTSEDYTDAVDEQFEAAINGAMEQSLDGWLECDVTVAVGFNAFIGDLEQFGVKEEIEQ